MAGEMLLVIAVTALIAGAIGFWVCHTIKKDEEPKNPQDEKNQSSDSGEKPHNETTS